MSGAKALIASLEKEGVEYVFGLPGGANLPIYDALVGAGLRHILVRHEQSAAHMADGHAPDVGGQRQVARQLDVQPGGAVAGA